MKNESAIVNRKDRDKLFELDPVFIQIHEQFGEPPNWKRDEGFESLVKIIIEQQVSLESGKATFNRLKEYVVEIRPENIVHLSDQELREAYLSRQKARYLRELSKAVLNDSLQLDKLKELEFQECRQQLTSIVGIGNWTADIYQMICLQEKDIFPPGDVAIINSIKHLTEHQTIEEILDRTEKWKPLRSLASFYLWHHHMKQSGRNVIY